MVRWCLYGSAAVLISLCLPTRAEAAFIQCATPSATCQEIGLFDWSSGTLTDDVFTLFNISDLSSVPPGGGEFTGVHLDLDGSAGFADTSVPIGGQIDSGAVNFFFGTTLAQLTFTYQGSPFTAQLTSTGSQVLLAESVVPEPSTLLLLSTGLLAMRIARRRRA